MTSFEEARRIIGGLRPCQDLGETKGSVMAALLVACDALEKQIPKKPCRGKHTIYACPSCGNEEIDYDFQYNYNYCPECGQALDWSETK